jgi:hypothetical protein
MELTLRYATVRSRLRKYVSGHVRMLDFLRIVRCALLQGPWQALLVRHYRTHPAHPPIRVNAETLFPDVDPVAAAEVLRRDACAPGLKVPHTLVDEIVAFARARGGTTVYDPDLECEAVRTLSRDPLIVDVVRRFLGAEPVLLKSQIYWTVPDGTKIGNALAAAEGGRFHYDLADIRAVTVFIYLTDVDEGCGPHIVIRGTQRRRTPGQILRRCISDEHAERAYGDRIQVITGPAGTGWFEDITCYHKQAPAERIRGMIYLIYSLHRKQEAPPAR